MKKQAGFTLVEIAIVLVIIGLLIGGVLKGQEIITNAKVKNLENDFNGIKAAIYSYQDRYRALPGDDNNADRFADIAVCTTSLCGDGDGVITGTFDSSTGNPESLLFWMHLREAGFVVGASNDQEQPNNAFGGIIGVSTNNTTPSLSGNFVGFTNIPQNIAIIIEARLDDGLSASGNIIGFDSDDNEAANYADDVLYQLFFSW